MALIPYRSQYPGNQLRLRFEKNSERTQKLCLNGIMGVKPPDATTLEILQQDCALLFTCACPAILSMLRLIVIILFYPAGTVSMLHQVSKIHGASVCLGLNRAGRRSDAAGKQQRCSLVQRAGCEWLLVLVLKIFLSDIQKFFLDVLQLKNIAHLLEMGILQKGHRWESLFTFSFKKYNMRLPLSSHAPPGRSRTLIFL